jgi:acyl carrier protein
VVGNFLFGSEEGLADDTSFLDAGIVDSTGVLELVAHLEQRYGINVDDGELIPDNLDSITAIAGFVTRKRHGLEPTRPVGGSA